MIQDVLRDFVLVNAADRMVGRIDSFKPPALKVMHEDFRGAGMDTTLPVDMGMETMEASWVTSGIDRAMYTGFGVITGLPTTIKVRCSLLDPVTGIPKPLEHTMLGKIVSIESSDYKPGERATLTCSMKLTYYKLTHTIPGLPAVEIDVINGVRIIQAVDQLIAMRVLVGR